MPYFSKPPLLLAAGALVCALVSAAARANDATFGGSGADLVPLAEQQVQMKSEDVVLTASNYEWSVQAQYVFFNPGQSSVKLQVGFPEYRCEADSDCANVAFRDLRTDVDGVAVQHRQGKLEKGQGWADFLGVVWLFDVEFPAGKEVHIRHQYRLQAGGDVDGNLYTSYVTRTGRSWAGPIGSARFRALLPPYTRAVLDPRVKGLTTSGPRLQQGADPHVELVLEGKNWLPQGGVHFLYNASASLSLEQLDLAKVAAAKALPITGSCNPGRDADEMQRCLNELYAAKGYPFKNAAIASKYYSGNAVFRVLDVGEQRYWVRDASPLAAFSTSWFLPAEAAQIKDWTEAAARERAAAAKAEQPGSALAEASVSELPRPPVPSSPPSTPGAQPPTQRVNTTAAPSVVARETASKGDPLQPAPASAAGGRSQCGCRLPRAAAPGAAWLWLGALGALSMLRRGAARL